MCGSARRRGSYEHRNVVKPRVGRIGGQYRQPDFRDVAYRHVDQIARTTQAGLLGHYPNSVGTAKHWASRIAVLSHRVASVYDHELVLALERSGNIVDRHTIGAVTGGEDSQLAVAVVSHGEPCRALWISVLFVHGQSAAHMGSRLAEGLDCLDDHFGSRGQARRGEGVVEESAVLLSDHEDRDLEGSLRNGDPRSDGHRYRRPHPVRQVEQLGAGMISLDDLGHLAEGLALQEGGDGTRVGGASRKKDAELGLVLGPAADEAVPELLHELPLEHPGRIPDRVSALRFLHCDRVRLRVVFDLGEHLVDNPRPVGADAPDHDVLAPFGQFVDRATAIENMTTRPLAGRRLVVCAQPHGRRPQQHRRQECQHGPRPASKQPPTTAPRREDRLRSSCG